ncbi:MAG: hypothetical protein ACNA8K_16675 [Cyclonatronaceae bacterium]
MKIAVIGEKTRARAWEKHLRTISSVSEVVITSSIHSTEAPVCILINDSAEKLSLLTECVKRGYHTYLVSHLPDNLDEIESAYHAAEEAKVHVQLSHWPTHSSMIKEVQKQIERPASIVISKELSLQNYSNDSRSFSQQWLDELALILKLHNSSVQHIMARPIEFDGRWWGLSVTLRFDHGGLGTLYFSTFSEEDRHRRLFSTGQISIDTDVLKQRARILKPQATGGLSITQKSFDPSDTARLSVIHFIRSVQMNTRPDFSLYDALQTAKTAQKIHASLHTF